MSRSLSLTFFAVSIFTTSFLLFCIQPLVSRAILPWFGGAPAVWTVCMLFFQVMLLAGYAGAHALERVPARLLAFFLYVSLVVGTLLYLNVLPDPSLKPDGVGDPAYRILTILTLHIGLPFFVLSMASPLLQVWLSRVSKSENPYWLYSVSNVGSLLALLSYPFVFEPLFTVPQQAALWNGGFFFAAALLTLASIAASFSGSRRVVVETSDVTSAPISMRTGCEIFLFSTFGSVLLLAFTNHVCHDIAVIPLLWILPLALYLLTFVFAFSGISLLPEDHMRKIALLMIFLLGDRYTGGADASVFSSISLSFGTLFVCCMLAHSAMYRRKPSHERLTSFYLLLSAGGATGGLALALLAPRIFSSYLELPLALLAFSVYLIRGLYLDTSIAPRLQGIKRMMLALAVFALIAFRLMVLLDVKNESVVYRTRNFFGVLRVVEEEYADSRMRGLRHGRILHGIQYLGDGNTLRSRTYYRDTSGIARTIRAVRKRRRAAIEMGVVGLGVGEILAHAHQGDKIRFYELDPDVGKLAHSYFTFLSSTPAEVEVRYGDGRMVLEGEAPNNFDILFIDAFSSDAIPLHLLTREAFALYFRHLKEDGVLVVHISNRHMDLSGVLAALASELEMPAEMIKDDVTDEGARDYNNRHVVITQDAGIFENQAFSGVERERLSERKNLPAVWTDSHSDVLSCIDWFSSLGKYFTGGS